LQVLQSVFKGCTCFEDIAKFEISLCPLKVASDTTAAFQEDSFSMAVGISYIASIEKTFAVSIAAESCQPFTCYRINLVCKLDSYCPSDLEVAK